jgi:hypothetical protein
MTVSNVDKYQLHFIEDNVTSCLKLKCFVFVKLLKVVLSGWRFYVVVVPVPYNILLKFSKMATFFNISFTFLLPLYAI